MAFSGHNTMDKLDDCVEPNASDVHSSQITTTTSKQKKASSGSFTFVDFCPEYRRKPDSWFFQSDYQTFSEVFHKINEWLSENPNWQVKTAETLFYDSVTGFGQKLPFFAGKLVRRNLRAVRYRLWLVPTPQKKSFQKIGCINVVPRIKIINKDSQISNLANDHSNNVNDNSNTYSMDLRSNESSLTSSPNYETLDEMLVRVNELMANKPINGQILNVETIGIPVESNCWSVDTESLFWSDECQSRTNTVFILRIFFEYGNTKREELQIVDFVPRVQMWDTPLAVPIYETFSSLLSRSSQWLRDQEPGLRFLSCNTVEAPVDYGFNAQSIKENINLGNNSIDSRRMFYPCNTKTDKTNIIGDKYSLKFLRLSVVRPQSSSPESHFPLNRDPVILNCKIFVPNKIPNGVNSSGADYESISLSKRKIEAWIMTTGARILSAETNVISIPFSSSSIATSVDSCLKSNSSNVLSHYLTIYRIYLNGHYLEPPARLLPLSLGSEEDPNENNSNCSLM